MYLTFSEYQKIGGTMDETAFRRMEFRSEKLVDRFTQNRIHAMKIKPMRFIVNENDEHITFAGTRILIEPITDAEMAIKRCIFELVEAMGISDPTKVAVSNTLSGFSNDGYSESYTNHVTTQSLEMAFYGIIRDYLSTECDYNGTPLMYVGVDA